MSLVLPGSMVAFFGLALRAWSAGVIRKDECLTTHGPFAYTRNPLYLGSLLIGVGVTVAGGHWIWPAIFAGYYAMVYIPTIRREERLLTDLFPQAWPRYAEAVPAFLPRLTPYLVVPGDEGAATAPGFRWHQYVRNREWEAALGVAAAFAVLLVKTTLVATAWHALFTGATECPYVV